VSFEHGSRSRPDRRRRDRRRREQRPVRGVADPIARRAARDRAPAPDRGAGGGWLALDGAHAAADARDARDRALAAVDRAERATGELRRALDQTAHELSALRVQFDAMRRPATETAETAGTTGTAPRRDPHPAPAGAHGRPAQPPPRRPVTLDPDCLVNPLCDAPASSAARRI
jgi:hypothetical protein